MKLATHATLFASAAASQLYGVLAAPTPLRSSSTKRADAAVTIDDADERLNYVGEGWTHLKDQGETRFQGTESFSNDPKAYIEVPTRNEDPGATQTYRVTIYGGKKKDRGMFDVWQAGEKQGQGDAYDPDAADSTTESQVLYVNDQFKVSGTAPIQIKNVEFDDRLNAVPYLDIDGIEISFDTGKVKETTLKLDDSDEKIKYSGDGWTHLKDQGEKLNDGTQSFSKDPNAYIELPSQTPDGTVQTYTLTIYGGKKKDRGLFDVYSAGDKYGQGDAFDENAEEETDTQVIYVNDQVKVVGQRPIQIKNVGTDDRIGGPPYLDIDYVELKYNDMN